MNKLNKYIKLSLLIMCAYVAFQVFFHRSQLFTPVDIVSLKEMYVHSNYVLGDKGNKMSDEHVYTYAGYVYMSGESPTSVNFEHPPFMKYLYGISTILLGNPNWIVAGFVVVQAFCIIFLANSLYKNKKLIVVSLLLFFSNSLVYWYFSKALLDIPLAGMMLISIVVYSIYMKRPSIANAIFLGISFGLYFSTKYPFPLSIGLWMLLLMSIWMKYKNIKDIFIIVITTAVTYVSTYMMFFVKGNTILDFLRFELWRLHWYMGKTDGPRALILQTIFLGRHAAWWAHDGSVVMYPNYTIIWPMTFLIFVGSFIKKIWYSHIFVPFRIWTVCAFLILLIGASNDFYLITLLPGFVLFGVKMFDRQGKEKV